MTLMTFGRYRRSLFTALGKHRLNRQTSVALATAALWQIANYAIPLATFPYLARVLGVHGFGLLAIAGALVSYALLVTDWGFNLTATQAISRARADPVAVNAIIWSTILAKAILASLSCVVVVAACNLLTIDRVIRTVIELTLLSVLASVFTIDWALRGVESIRSFAAASILGRLVSVPATFILVRHSDDVALAALSGALGSLATAALTLIIGARLGLIRRPMIEVRQAFTQIMEGAHIFMSMAATSMYTSCLALVLGWTSGPTEVGVFNGADRIRRPVQSLLSPIELVFYPRLSALAAADPVAARRLSLKILAAQSATSLALSLILCLLAPQAVHLVLGSGFDASIPVLRCLSAIVFLIGLNNVLGLMILLPFGMRREFSLSTLAGAFVGVSLAIPLSLHWGAIGTAFAALGAELCVVLLMFGAARQILYSDKGVSDAVTLKTGVRANPDGIDVPPSAPSAKTASPRRITLLTRTNIAPHAGGKAPSDVQDICRGMGLTCISLPIVPEKRFTLANVTRFTLGTLTLVVHGLLRRSPQVLIIQHPIVGRFEKRMTHSVFRSAKKVVLIHDLDFLRKPTDHVYDDLQFLGQCDVLIAHNEAMRQALVKTLPGMPILVLGVFDFLLPAATSVLPAATGPARIFVIGNLHPMKAAYLYKVSPLATPIVAFGPNCDVERLPETVDWMGIVGPAGLPVPMIDGFGLVWDGESPDRLEGQWGEYLKVNAPHKLSLYVVLGLPIIVHRDSAMAEFVVAQGIGFTTESIDAASRHVRTLSAAQWQSYIAAVLHLRQKLVSGFHTARALEKALSLLD